jgi:5-methyltetrahydrofolate--homocysteine methyltransferase
MQTTIRSAKKTVTIDTAGPVVIIGEKINPTGHKRMAAAIQQGDYDYIREIAQRQVQYSADILDINVGVPGVDDVAMMAEVVRVVSEVVDVPLCLDSPNPSALAAGLEAVQAVGHGNALVNSVSGEQDRLQKVLPLVKDYGAAVIGLTMDDNGIPADVESRVAIAERILESAARLGIAAHDVIIDPLVMTVSSDSQAGVITLRTIELLHRNLGVNVNLGASNVSFGLPDRPTINATFMAIAISRGATCVISDPMKMTGIVRSSDLLLGRDEYAMRYIRYFRSLPKEEKQP